MTVGTYIQDPKTQLKAEVVNEDEKNALVVATRELKTYSNKINFFTNPDNGSQIAIDASQGGTPIGVHNGIDTVLWTGSSIVGTDVDFNSATRPRTGTYSVEVDEPGLLDTWQFAKGSSQDLTGYVSLTIWVNVDRLWDAGDSISVYGWDTGTGTIVGNEVNLEDYIDPFDFDVWQKASIPFADMGLENETIDAFRMKVEGEAGRNFELFIDDMQIEETGAPVIYTVKPDRGTWLHIDKLMVFYADAYTGVVADGTMPSIPYDSILGMGALRSGIVYQRIQNGEVQNSFPIRQHGDLMNLSKAEVTGCGSDGTNSWVSVSVDFSAGIILKYETRDELRITISEDLSGLLDFKLSAGGFEEYRQ